MVERAFALYDTRREPKEDADTFSDGRFEDEGGGRGGVVSGDV